MLMPITLPPGVYKNGTDYQSKGRWFNSSLVRWYEGTIRPVGGWRKKSNSTVSGLCRGTLAWRDNDNDRWIALGTNTNLYVMSEGGILADITPSSFTSGLANASYNNGYGGNTFGTFAYGVARPDSASITPAATWTMDTWGEYLIACSSSDGRLLEWQLSTGSDAAPLANAPINNKAVLVTEERFVFALGADGVGRRVQWCDQENNTLWTPAITNQAGDFDLETPGTLIAGKRLRGVNLLFTDVDVHAANYVGPPFVYGFERIAAGCGLIGPQAVAAVESVAFWMSPAGFFIYDGFVKPISCDVLDYVFTSLNDSQRSKIYAVANNQFGEIWWFYPSATSLEIDSYVSYNYRENHWAVGSLSRTAGTDRGVFNYPMMVSIDGYVYEHEVGLDYDGASPFAETGPFELGNGDRTLMARQLIPDEKALGAVSVQFKTKLTPQGAESTKSYTINGAYTNVRFSGRQAAMRVTGASPNTDWRLGTMRLDVVESGRR
jgi:hypothetical protein